MSLPSLPAALESVDLGSLESLRPEALLANPAQLYDLPPGKSTARALRYSRNTAGRSYDEIGFRLRAVNPRQGVCPLQTLQSARLDRDQAQKSQLGDSLAAIVDQQQKLRHRLLDLPSDTGRLAYRIDGRLIHIDAETDRGEETWTFPLTAPLSILQQGAQSYDASPLIAQKYQVKIPGSFWLPLPALIERGRFLRFQDWRDELRSDTQPGQFYCFVSHRWLTPQGPDPDGVQAAFLAWQLLASLCDAVRIAKYRGLQVPRMRSSTFGFRVGIGGNDLTEVLVVSVLREALTSESVESAWKEVRSLAEFTDDNGAAAAAQDHGLFRMREVLAGCPILASLIARVHVWYDFSCMPQPPRTPEDEPLFRQGLQSLSVIQILGHTVILLDEAEDYLSRGWCTLEALVADTEGTSMQVLIGSVRRTARDGTPEFYFETLLQDRPHIVWRAVLDTEVLGVQTPDECLARLALAVTDPNDVPFIYQGLRGLRSPTKLHTDDGELYTGVYPLPVVDESFVLAPTSTERAVDSASPPTTTHSIDWTPALRLSTAWKPEFRSDANFEPFQVLSGKVAAAGHGCHVALIVSCEGEAVLLANWCRTRRAEIEELLNVSVQSISWLAADIAPVGHLTCATLQPLAIEAAVWVFVAIEMRYAHCGVSGSLIETAAASGARTWCLSIDRHKDNLILSQPTRRETRRLPRVERFSAHTGGLFRSSIPGDLFEESP